jgi:predicted ATPase/DNA-binding SARP family transcriptional activator
MEARVLLRVLGPIEVLGRDGPVALGGAKPRSLLAALAIRRGATCTTDELIDALWGESPPPSAPKLLQVYVSQLRKVLPAGMRLVTGATGYALEVDPADVDVVVFEGLVADGRAALRAANPARATSALARGLALWRGPAYADVRYESFAHAEVERLERLHDLALLDRVDADLALGRHADVIGGLRGILAIDPTREDIAVRAMLAAYRTAGPSEALAIFATVRDALLGDLDEQPSRELVTLRDRIVERDPALDLQPGERATVRAGAELPLAPNALIGRQRELAELQVLLARPGVRLVSLTGAGGSGKSRLALELARELEPTFANGAILVELASLVDPELVPASIAQALALDPGRDALMTLGDALGDRELLLVLDNVEHLRAAAPELVRLLASAPHLRILVTTRVVLHVSGEHVYPVAPLAERDAVALFAERARAHDSSFVLDAASGATINSICRRLDGLPLAIELAATRVRALGLRTLDARLASRLTTLAGGPRDLPARQQTLRETLAWSVNLLEPRHAEVLATLAVFPGSCSMAAAEAVAGADDESMIALVDHNLVQVLEVDGERRFRLLETVREYAYELLGSRRKAAESALSTWMVGVVEGAALDAGGPPQVSALRRLDEDLDSLRDALRHAAQDPDPTPELALASGAWRYWWIRGHLAEGRAVLEGIIERRGLIPTHAGSRTALAAAQLAWSMGDNARARALAADALDLAVHVGDITEQLSAHILFGLLAMNIREFGTAEQHFFEAIRLAESDGNLGLAYTARLNLAISYRESGRLNEAREHFRAVLDYCGEGLSEGVGFAHLNLGETEYAAGKLAMAEEHLVAAAEAFRAVGFKVRLANALQGLAAVEARTGRAESAARRLGSAAALIGDTGWGADGSELVPAATAAAREALGDEAFDRLFGEGASSGAP